MKPKKQKTLKNRNGGNRSTNHALADLSGSFLIRSLNQAKKGIKKILKTVNKGLAQILILFIKLYQRTLSPDKGLPSFWLRGRICHHTPHCSQYSLEVLKKYGFYPGVVYMIDRVTSCTGSTNIKNDPSTYDIIFFSSAPIGIPFLEKISSDPRYNLTGVVTTQDKPAGRGMKMKPNIIKTAAQKIRHSGIEGNESYPESISKIILIHGKNTDPSEKRYPRFVKKMEEQKIRIFAPKLPKADTPILKERLVEIDKCEPDENTIMIGHSRGGVAILRWLEKNYTKKVKKVILVATNDGHTKYMRTGETSNDFYKEGGYDFDTIKKTCNDFVSYHSIDDQRVDYEQGVNNSQGLGAKFHSFTDKKHFGSNLVEEGFHELLEEVIPKQNFIQTPPSLRLSSKKHSSQAQEFTNWLEAKNPDFLVVIAYGKIIPQHILDIPNIAPINVHGSILPHYRGASPIQSVFLDGKDESGIAIMKMDAGLDTGDILTIKKTKLKFDRTALDLIKRMQQAGPMFLNHTLRDFAKGHIESEKQDDQIATHCGKLEKEQAQIDPFKDSLKEIYNIYRGCYLRPKAHFFLDEKRGTHKDKRIIIEKIELDENILNKSSNQPLLQVQSSELSVHNAVKTLILKPEGKKSMTREEFTKGYHYSECEEYLDLVDEKDNVIGKETRGNIYKNGQNNYRCTNIFIINDQKQILVPLRDSKRSIFPNCYDFSCGEHVQSGETYQQAAVRGLKEELNIETTKDHLHKLKKRTPQHDEVSCHLMAYILKYESETSITGNKHEGVEKLMRMTLEEIKTHMEEIPEKRKGDMITIINQTKEEDLFLKNK